MLTILPINEFKEIKEPQLNTVAISVTDPGAKKVQNRSCFVDMLEVSFWDVEEAIGSYTPISDEIAAEIADFIKKHKDRKLIVHCTAGQSRSPAIGLAYWLWSVCDGDLKKFRDSYNPIVSDTYFSPNYVVFEKIKKALLNSN